MELTISDKGRDYKDRVASSSTPTSPDTAIDFVILNYFDIYTGSSTTEIIEYIHKRGEDYFSPRGEHSPTNRSEIRKRVARLFEAGYLESY